SVYKNDAPASYYDVVPGYNECIRAYRYTDTNMDGLYDTVYIDYEEIFMVGSVNATYKKIYVNYDAMRTSIISLSDFMV
ncbi:MAG: hypothetical protein IKJ45_05480, partial [Kiritimatiellae bacterium]|nr:hypothetical protein [Kiritimatiellia bacterium]